MLQPCISTARKPDCGRCKVSDPLATTNPRRAWHDGRAAGRAEVAVVLLDLIAELRAIRYIAFPGEEMGEACDRAEARLREVGDE